MKEAKNIILTGFMGTGKTRVGRALAARLKYPFVDIDFLIEKTTRQKISRIFEEKGEKYFRRLETATIKEALQGKKKVVATGGGSLLLEENRLLLQKGGVVICLSASPAEIFDRVSHRKNRPLLKNKDILAEIKKLLLARQKYYNTVPYQISTTGKTPQEVVLEIEQLLKKNNYGLVPK